MSRSFVLLPVLSVALALTLTPLASAQVTNAGGTAFGTGIYNQSSTTVFVDVTGTPQSATGPVTGSQDGIDSFIGIARCIAIDATATGFRASIAGQVTGGIAFPGAQGFELTIYDNSPSLQTDKISNVDFYSSIRTGCGFNLVAQDTLDEGDFLITPTDAGVCPPAEDRDRDGLTNARETLFSTLLWSRDSDRDGIADGNDDANRNGEDDEDEDDDDEDGCPDEDSDDDGEDDEDEDDDEEDDD